MQRRKFLKDSGLVAIGLGVFGSIHGESKRFTGDSPTTTDILGPFYRPGAPFRKNLNPVGFKGEVLHFSGTIFKEDGKTPFKNAMVEIWQCDPDDALYDNTSEDFLYRASQKTGADGKYYFITAVPIPYPNEENSKDYRPAHIHMRISGKGQQDLITQVYFSGDPYLQTDPSSRSPLAINRILKLKKVKSNESEVEFDIILKKEFLPDPGVFRKISGIYKMNDLSLMEFYQDGDLLFWKWNGQIRGGLSYKGNNSFEGGISDIEARFELLPKGDAKLVFLLSRRRMIKLEGKKVLTYKAPGNRS